MLDDQLAALGISVRSLQARGLTRHQVASDLHIAEVGSDGREHRLVFPAAKAWAALKRQALSDGEIVYIVSAFRGVERQAEIIRRKLDSGETLETILTVCAPPGYSEHHTGRAVDLGTPGSAPLDVEFERTSAFNWLQRNAASFGFSLSYPVGNSYGYAYEPWHWCFRGNACIPLRHRPDLCSFFVPHFEAEWPDWYGAGGKGDARQDLEAFANPEGNLPVGVVALDAAGLPVGIAALKATSIATHSYLSPWATAGYVIPNCRRAGIGARLLSALIAEARRLGFQTIYCATATAGSLLEREGWSQFDAVVHDGEKHFIFRQVVPGADRP